MRNSKVTGAVRVGLPGLTVGGSAPVKLIGSLEGIAGQERCRSGAAGHRGDNGSNRTRILAAGRRIQRKRALNLGKVERRYAIAEQQQGQQDQGAPEHMWREEPVAAQQRTTQTGHANSFDPVPLFDTP
jgi:hypothetical protein